MSNQVIKKPSRSRVHLYHFRILWRNRLHAVFAKNGIELYFLLKMQLKQDNDGSVGAGGRLVRLLSSKLLSEYLFQKCSGIDGLGFSLRTVFISGCIRAVLMAVSMPHLVLCCPPNQVPYCQNTA